MKKSKIASHNLLVNQQRVTLLELLDRLLDKGVVAKGEIILSVAEIDLVYLNLGLLLSSVKTIEKARKKGDLIREVPISCSYDTSTISSKAVSHGLAVALAALLLLALGAWRLAELDGRRLGQTGWAREFMAWLGCR